MKILNNVLKKHSKKIPKFFAALFLVISFFGFLDASYLTYHHYKGTPPPCSILRGCDVVTTSSYATVLGIPLALLGALYYLSIFLAVIYYFDRKDERIFAIVPLLTIFGFLASLYLVYLQLVVIQYICLYCMFSAGTSTLLFLLGLAVWFGFPPQKDVNNNNHNGNLAAKN